MTIITTKKPFEEVLGALRNAKKISIVSCGSCAASCNTGGTENAKEMAENLEKEGYIINIVTVSEEICDNQILRKVFQKIDKDLNETDAIITLSCGLGVASITEVLSEKYSKIPVITASNTEFMGTSGVSGFYQGCVGCGDCLLNETGGICPLTTCAKSLLNGPCGGMVRGKCEVGNYEEDCGWILIYNRLKELDRLDLFSKVRDPRDWKDSGHQRKVVVG
jgi:ferredoxin